MTDMRQSLRYIAKFAASSNTNEKWKKLQFNKIKERKNIK